jgi:recombination protein RecT
MASEVIKVTAGELILPKPQHDGAAMVVRKMPSILQQLPSEINRAAWAAAVVGEVNRVSNCEPASVATAVYNLAFLGLFPGSALGHAYFVPFKGKATLIPGYKGFLDLAFGTGFLRDIHCDVICRDEPFEYWKDETGPRLNHRPPLDRRMNRETIIGAYCLYHTRDGGYGIKVINREDIQKSDKGRDVWNSDFASMVLKTAVRRASKEWKLTGRLGRAIELDERYERDEDQGLPAELMIDDEAVPAATWTPPLE